jgi:hypothetical protein
MIFSLITNVSLRAFFLDSRAFVKSLWTFFYSRTPADGYYSVKNSRAFNNKLSWFIIPVSLQVFLGWSNSRFHGWTYKSHSFWGKLFLLMNYFCIFECKNYIARTLTGSTWLVLKYYKSNFSHFPIFVLEE